MGEWFEKIVDFAQLEEWLTSGGATGFHAQGLLTQRGCGARVTGSRQAPRLTRGIQPSVPHRGHRGLGRSRASVDDLFSGA